jgi:DNA-binding transcriptional LysR family regulator
MDLRRYDLNLLVTLEALLEEGSVTGAARRLSLSQSAVSAALDRLRGMFADPLLVRVGNRMQPTPFARRLQGPLKTALASVSLALALSQRFDPAKARLNVRLGITDYVGLMVLPSLYRTLAREAPGITLEVLPRPVEDSVARIVSGEIDIAPIVDPPEGRDLFNAPLVEESFVCAMRAGHPLARARLTTARLLEYPHLAVTAHVGAAKLVERAFAERGLRRRVPASVAGFATSFALLAESDLVAIIPGGIARQQAARFGLAIRPPPLPIPRYTLSIVWHQRTAHDAAHRWFREQLLAAGEASAGNRRRR